MKTKYKLVEALKNANAPAEMIEKARYGYYDDFETTIATPLVQLIHDARAAGLTDIAERTMAGEFDASVEEGEAWFSAHAEELFGDLKDVDPFNGDREDGE